MRAFLLLVAFMAGTIPSLHTRSMSIQSMRRRRGPSQLTTTVGRLIVDLHRLLRP